MDSGYTKGKIVDALGIGAPRASGTHEGEAVMRSRRRGPQKRYILSGVGSQIEA